MSLSREAILAARRNRKPQRLEVPEWGGDVFVKVLSAEDQVALGETYKPNEMPAAVLVRTLVDENGERLFGDHDMAELMKEDAPVILEVFAFAAKLNGLSSKELEEAVELFRSAPTPDSLTG